MISLGHRPLHSEVSSQRDMGLNESNRQNGNGDYPNHIDSWNLDDWESFVKNHRQEWISYVCKYGNMQTTEADDVVQEMLFRIWQNKDKNGITNLRQYIFSCLKNISVDSRRGKALKTVSITEKNHLGLTLAQSLQSLGLTLVESLVSEEQVRRIQGIIAGLPQPLRESLNLYIAGVSESDAANQLGLSSTAYKLRVFRAKNMLEQRLLAQGVRFERVKHAKPNKKLALK